MDNSRRQQHGSATTGVDVEAQEETQLGESHSVANPDIISQEDASTDDFIRPRLARSNTAQTFQGEIPGKISNWYPGGEPGLDPTQPETVPPSDRGGLPLEKTIHQQCEITVVDFSRDKIRMWRLDNDTLEAFLKKEMEPWVVCRWINVNGISWDVVKQLANHKNLHRLALEDLMDTTNRTKVDWYSDQAYIVLAMQKLISLPSEEDGSDSDKNDGSEKRSSYPEKSRNYWKGKRKKKKRGVVMSALLDLLRPASQKKHLSSSGERQGNGLSMSPVSQRLQQHNLRTLQRFQGESNEDRIDFMERHASLAPRSLGVAVEQVSMFLHADNTVTSFFEASADDIEQPILRRLRSQRTLLRQSCDASMLVEAVLDAITDLSLPVTAAYQDAIGDLELEVLTDPDIQQCTSLYILTSEITTLRNITQPITGVINSLRDYRPEQQPPAGRREPSTPSYANRVGEAKHPKVSPTSVGDPEMPSAVTISAMCRTYLGDVLDQCITITDGYDQMRRSADNMIDLIFNTVGASQNESMKQLTIVTCMFLPPTFLTGYFGMNFEPFTSIEHSEAYFWVIAVPVVIVVTAILMREMIQRYLKKIAQKHLIQRSKKRRRPR